MALRNLKRNLHMFLEILEPKVKNQKKSLEKTVLIEWSQICNKINKFVHKISLKKKVCRRRYRQRRPLKQPLVQPVTPMYAQNKLHGSNCRIFAAYISLRTPS